MKKFPLRFLKAKDASVMIIFALALPVLIGLLGLTISYSGAYNNRSHLQEAVDSAALAATALPGTATAQDRIARANQIFMANIETLMNGSSAPPVADFQVESGKVAVIGSATQQVDNLFNAFIGSEEIGVGVNSKAVKDKSAPVCILMLNPDSDRGIELYGRAKLTAHDCAGQANSIDSHGMLASGLHSIATAEQFGVTGGYDGENFHPMPTTGVERTSDPYADLPFPATGPCVDVEAKMQQAIVTLSPGTYCGGLEIKAQSEVTLSPGIYIMKDGPFRVDSDAQIRGEEVMIAFLGAGSLMYLRGGADIVLTSPMSGIYKNMQFMSDGVITEEGSWKGQEWVELHGGITLDYDGVMYLPEQDLWFAGSSTVKAHTPTMAMVADQLWLQSNFELEVWRENRRGLDIEEEAPRFEYGAVLVN